VTTKREKKRLKREEKLEDLKRKEESKNSEK
jgi:hypothetical protein